MSFAKRLEEAQRAAQIKALGGEAAYQDYRKRKRRADLISRGITGVVTAALATAGYYVVAWVIQVAWNTVAGDLGAPRLSFGACCGIVLLLIVIKSFFKRSKD